MVAGRFDRDLGHRPIFPSLRRCTRSDFTSGAATTAAGHEPRAAAGHAGARAVRRHAPAGLPRHPGPDRLGRRQRGGHRPGVAHRAPRLPRRLPALADDRRRRTGRLHQPHPHRPRDRGPAVLRPSPAAGRGRGRARRAVGRAFRARHRHGLPPRRVRRLRHRAVEPPRASTSSRRRSGANGSPTRAAITRSSTAGSGRDRCSSRCRCGSGPQPPSPGGGWPSGATTC
jgi:hypothetical protein